MIYLMFIIGLVFGSFFMVVALRLPVSESIIKPASHCDNCLKPLKAWELIPLLSYFLAKGKCRNCGKKISFWYPLVEFFCGLLFATAYILYGEVLNSYEFIAALIISSILIIIFVSDFKYKIILDSPIVIGSITFFILKYIYFGSGAFAFSILSAISLFAFLFTVKFLGDKIFKRESLGGGDIKLAFLIGAILGVKLGLTSLILASFLALPYAIIVSNLKKEQEIPFGPFLILSVYLVYIFMNFFTDILTKIF